MINYYKIFVSNKMFILKIAEMLLLFALVAFEALFLDIMPIVAVITFTLLHVIFSTMADFFVLSGIAIKHQKIMEYCKSSLKGPDLVKKGVLADALSHVITTSVISIFGYIIAKAVIGELMGIFDIMYAVSTGCVAIIAISLTLLLTRRVCKSMQAHMLISYLMASLASLLHVPGILIYPTMSIGFMTGYAALSVIVTALLVWALTKQGVSGFMSGYYDK